MFNFIFSDHIYDETMWPHVYRIEILMHGILREFWHEMVGLSDDELIAMLRDTLQRTSSHAGQDPLPDASIVTEVLCHGVVGIARFVADPQATNPTGKIDTRDPRLAVKVNVERLRECMSRSEDFRKFILRKRKA